MLGLAGPSPRPARLRRPPLFAQLEEVGEQRAARDRVHPRRDVVVDVRQENAVDFTVPEGNLLVTLYNPFLGKTFQQCIEHLHRAALSEPARKIWLAYINPWFCEETLELSGYFRRVQQYRPIPRQWAWSLWRHV